MFVRIGKSYIINRSCIFQISVQRQKLLLSDAENFSYTLEVSKEALKRLKELLVGKLSQ